MSHFGKRQFFRIMCSNIRNSLVDNVITSHINLNPIGVNLEARAGFSGVMLYARAGITPLLNKTKAPECYPMTIGLGFRL